jgi:hypothetical protein
MTNQELDALNIRETAIRAFIDGDTETLRKCAAILRHRTAQQDALDKHDYERLDDLQERSA